MTIIFELLLRLLSGIFYILVEILIQESFFGMIRFAYKKTQKFFSFIFN